MHVNDLKHAALLTLMGETSGHITDLEGAWLATLGAESFEDLRIQLGFTSVSAWLASFGHTGTINDQWYSFWLAGGPIYAPTGLTSVGTTNLQAVVNWIDASVGTNPISNYIVRRAGQPDVPIAIAVQTYIDVRNIIPDSIIKYTVHTIDTSLNESAGAPLTVSIPL